MAFVNLKLHSKEKRLNLIGKEVGNCSGELTLTKEQMQLVRRKIEERNGKLDAKEKQLGTAQKSLKEFTGDSAKRSKEFTGVNFNETKSQETIHVPKHGLKSSHWKKSEPT